MMKSQNLRHRLIVGVFSFALLFILNATVALASEDAGWRPTYDLVMKWVNFGILAFVLVKYLKDPIKDFLFGQKAIIAREIEKLETEKEKTLEKINNTRKELEDSDRRLSDLTDRMRQQGEKEKEKIIEAARQQSRFMLEGAKRKVQGRIDQAKANFRSELIDLAVNAAMEKLPSQVTPEDNQKMASKFIVDTQGSSS